LSQATGDTLSASLEGSEAFKAGTEEQRAQLRAALEIYKVVSLSLCVYWEVFVML